MLIIKNHEVHGLKATITQAELLMQPILHESGASWWTADNADGTFALADVVNLNQRTQEQLEATPEYQAWYYGNPENMPALYVDISLTPTEGSSSFTGLSGLLAFPNNATGSFDVAASVWADEALTVPVAALDGKGWVFILRKINKQDGAVLDTLRVLKTFSGNTCQFTFLCNGISSGRYSLDEHDFDALRIDENTIFQFKIIVPNSPEGRRAFEFDIYDANL